MQRLLDASATTRGYKVDDIMDGKYGEPGAALMMFRTYPRIPFWEQMNDDLPFWTETGRMHSYVDIPEAIEYGENFIVHREGPEATPYLPNVIVSSNPLIRPEDYGIAPDEMDPDMRTVRNIRMPWSEVKQTTNPLWEDGFQFYFLTPKTRHTTHSGWAVTDWEVIWGSNFGDPRRRDKRIPARRRPRGPHEPGGGTGPGSPTATTSTGRREPTRPALPQLRPGRHQRPVPQGGPAHAAGEVQPRLPVQRGHGEARLLARDAEDRRRRTRRARTAGPYLPTRDTSPATATGRTRA